MGRDASRDTLLVGRGWGACRTQGRSAAGLGSFVNSGLGEIGERADPGTDDSACEETGGRRLSAEEVLTEKAVAVTAEDGEAGDGECASANGAADERGAGAVTDLNGEDVGTLD